MGFSFKNLGGAVGGAASKIAGGRLKRPAAKMQTGGNVKQAPRGARPRRRNAAKAAASGARPRRRGGRGRRAAGRAQVGGNVRKTHTAASRAAKPAARGGIRRRRGRAAGAQTGGNVRHGARNIRRRPAAKSMGRAGKVAGMLGGRFGRKKTGGRGGALGKMSSALSGAGGWSKG
jgi:hypothetical protein